MHRENPVLRGAAPQPHPATPPDGQHTKFLLRPHPLLKKGFQLAADAPTERAALAVPFVSHLHPIRKYRIILIWANRIDSTIL